MKKTLCALIFLSIFLLPTFHVDAGYVNGYYRSNGTYVNGYYRTSPDGNPYNNYGFPGNYNPNTGSITGGNPSTYLDNYYNKSSGSSYSPSYSGYSYPTTPTCPINSYYDGITSCKCNYGYVVSGGSCVSANSLCYNQTGYNSSYDSLSNTCKCDSGYIIGASGQCVSGNSYCSSQLGIMSRYNSLSKKCECMSGYEFDGSSCTYKKTNSSNYSPYSASSYDCPLNSHTSSSDSTKCECDYGYQINSAKTACVIISNDTSTSINNQACSNAYANSRWDGTKTSNGLLNCGCQNGYNWNTTKTSCVSNTYTSPTYTPPALSDETIGKNYYLTNKTCVGLLGSQYGACISYALNH